MKNLKYLIYLLIICTIVKSDLDDFDLLQNISYNGVNEPKILELENRNYFLAYRESNKIKYFFMKNGIVTNEFTSAFTIDFFSVASSIDKTHICVAYQAQNYKEILTFLIKVSDGTKSTETSVSFTPNWGQWGMEILSFSNQLKFVISRDYYDVVTYQQQDLFQTIVIYTNVSSAPSFSTSKINVDRNTPQLYSIGAGLLNTNIGKYVIVYNNSYSTAPIFAFNMVYRIFDETGTPTDPDEFMFYPHQGDRIQNIKTVKALEDGGFIISMSSFHEVAYHPLSSQELWIGTYKSDLSVQCTPQSYKTYVPNSQIVVFDRQAYIIYLSGENPNILIKFLILDLDLCTTTVEKDVAATTMINTNYFQFRVAQNQDINTKVIAFFYYDSGTGSEFREYFMEQITNCSEERCYSCFGDMVNSCTLCSGTTLADRKNRQRDDNQLCTCDDGYFEKENVFDCQQCAPQCQTCTITATNCGSCIGAHRSELPDCPCEDTYFEDLNGDCQSCDSNVCFNCITNQSSCTSCEEGKYLFNFNCLSCNPICKSCSGPDQCQECSTTNTNRTNNLPNCPCQPNHFDASDIINQYVDKSCTACELYCSSCQELQKCLTCKVETNRSTIIPYCFCDFNYYQNSNNCEPITYVNQLNCESNSDNLLFQQWQSFESVPITKTTGVITNQAHQFAVGQFLDFKEQQFGLNDVTLTFFIKINTFVDGQNIMTFNQSGNKNLFVNLVQSGSDNGLEFGYTSNGTIIKSQNLILDNSTKNDWQFITFTYFKNGKIMVYLDVAGQLKKQILIDNQGSASLFIPLENLQRETNKIGNFDGLIDQFQFFHNKLDAEVLECLGNICQFQCDQCQNISSQCKNCSGNRVDAPICDCPEGLNANAFNPFCQKNRNNCVSIPENGFVLGLLDYTNNGAAEDQQTVVSQKGYMFDDMLSNGSNAQQLKSNIKYTLGQEFSVAFWMNYVHFTQGSEDLGDGSHSMNIFTAYQDDGATRKDFSIRIDQIQTLLAIGIAYFDRETNLLVQYAADKIIYEDEGWVHIYVKISYYDWEIFKNGVSTGLKWKSPQEVAIEEWYFIWGGLSIAQRWAISQGLRFNGQLDEFLVYNRILSDSEILCLADKCDNFVNECYNEAQIDGFREYCNVLPDQQQILNLIPMDLTTQNSLSPVSQNAYQIDEIDEYLAGTPGETIEIGTYTTISFWYKIDNPSIIKQMFFSFSDGTNLLQLHRNSNTRLLWLLANTSNGMQKFYCFDCIEYYKWKHVNLVFEKKRWKIYMDGNDAFLDYDTNLELPQMQVRGELIQIGSSEGQLGFGGYIDQFIIYNRALQFNEILCLYDRCDIIRCDQSQDQILNSKPPTCQKGNQNCSLCKENREGDICDCPLVTYDINESFCNSCSWGCLECTKLECMQCVPSNPPRILENSCVCPIGYFDDSRGPSYINNFSNPVPNPYWECLECNYKCVSCFNFLECTECKVGIARQPQPYCECEYGYYDDLQNPDCKSCQKYLHKYCLSCEILKSGSLLCLQCQDMLKFDSDKQVCQCPPGTYTLDQDSTVCEECINNASCPGGNELILDAGFWRENQQTDVIIECINSQENCLGGIGDVNSCSEGNIGALCEACDIEGKHWGESYGNYKDYKCRKCKDQTNIWETISQILFILVLAISMLNSTITLIKEQQINRFLATIINGYRPINNDQTIYLKILTHYFYILQVITTFNLELPGFLSDATQTTGNPSKSIGYAFDCFLKSLQNSMPHSYFKIIWQVIVFVVLVFLSFLFIVIINKLQQKSSAIKLNQKKQGGLTISQMFFQSLICMFIFYQPSFVQNMVDSVACKTIDGKPYVVQNTSIKCYEGEYNEFSFLFIMPQLIVWIVLVPAFFFRKLQVAKRTHRTQNRPINQKQNQKKQKQILPNQDYEEKQNLNPEKQVYYFKEDDEKENRLQNPIFQNIFGFLYIEYSQEAYFWELVKIGQKLLIVIFLGFHSTEIKIKGILIFIVIFFYGLLLVRYRPYVRLKHTIVDIISTCVSGLSIILGLFIYQNQYPGWTYTAYTFLTLVNVLFIIMIIYFILYSIYQAKEDKIKKLAKKNAKLNKILTDQEEKKEKAIKNWKILQQRVQLFVLTQTLEHNFQNYKQISNRYDILRKPLDKDQIQKDFQILQEQKINHDIQVWKKFKQDVREKVQGKYQLTEKAVKLYSAKKQEEKIIISSSEILQKGEQSKQEFPNLRKKNSQAIQLNKSKKQLEENNNQILISRSSSESGQNSNENSSKRLQNSGNNDQNRNSVKSNIQTRRFSRISQKSKSIKISSDKDSKEEDINEDFAQKKLLRKPSPKPSKIINQQKKKKKNRFSQKNIDFLSGKQKENQ